MSRIITVDKITAAGCQLDTAIELIFRGRDVVSQCVLVHSAWGILKDILKKKHIESSRDWMPKLFPELEDKDVWYKLDFAWNFLKHAKEDHQKVLQMHSEYPENALFLAIYDLSQLTSQSKLMDIYQLWFIAKHKEVFDAPKVRELYLKATQIFPDLHTQDNFQQAQSGLDAAKDYCR